MSVKLLQISMMWTMTEQESGARLPIHPSFPTSQTAKNCLQHLLPNHPRQTMTHESSSAPLPLQPIKEVSQIPEVEEDLRLLYNGFSVCSRPHK
mmetsp:Transcript_31087/g.33963  ORF Transcript_31087/g.33963 Transcript_31087/m.33963 type:complete len:94 (-) Transcript_31087:4439-4720(-)